MASTAVRYPTPQRVDGSTQHTSVEVTDPLLCPPELDLVTRVSHPCICLCWGGIGASAPCLAAVPVVCDTTRLQLGSTTTRLDEAVISSAEGARFSGLCEPLSPSAHLRTRVAPPPSRRCQSLTTGARGRWSSRLVPVTSSSLAPFRRASEVRRQPAFSHAK